MKNTLLDQSYMYIIFKYARIKIQWHWSIWFERSLGQCLNYFNDYSIRLLVLYVYYLWEWFNHLFFNLETWYNYESGLLLPTPLSLPQRLSSSSLLRCPNYVGVGYMKFVSSFWYFPSQMNWTVASSGAVDDWSLRHRTRGLRGDLLIPHRPCPGGAQVGAHKQWALVHNRGVTSPIWITICLPNCEA